MRTKCDQNGWVAIVLYGISLNPVWKQSALTQFITFARHAYSRVVNYELLRLANYSHPIHDATYANGVAPFSPPPTPYPPTRLAPDVVVRRAKRWRVLATGPHFLHTIHDTTWPSIHHLVDDDLTCANRVYLRRTIMQCGGILSVCVCVCVSQFGYTLEGYWFF